MQQQFNSRSEKENNKIKPKKKYNQGINIKG